MDFIYLINRLTDMNYSLFFNKLDSLQKKTGMNKLYLLWDMLNCAVKYGAGYMDYDLFEMYSLTPLQRDTYITRGRNNALVRKYNDPKFVHFFDNKAEFYDTFSSFLHREWISLNADKEGVLSFIQNRDAFIAKPVTGSCGKGVEKIVTSNYTDPQSIYDKLSNIGQPYLLEDVIIQHPQIKNIYPEAINTLRVVTMRCEDKPEIVCTYFRIGNDSHYVDNFNSGGMVAPVDKKTGVVSDKAITKDKMCYAAHPSSGAAIEGFAFPFWKEAMDMVCRAAQVVPQIGYIGWDVAFTPEGPCLVEGNRFPGHDIYQLPAHTPDKHGIYENFLLE